MLGINSCPALFHLKYGLRFEFAVDEGLCNTRAIDDVNFEPRSSNEDNAVSQTFTLPKDFQPRHRFNLCQPFYTMDTKPHLTFVTRQKYRRNVVAVSGNLEVSDNVERRGWNERRVSNEDDSRRNWRNSEVVRRPSNGRNDYRGNYENGRQENQWFDSKNRFQQDDRFNDRGYQFRNGGQKDDFGRGNRRNRCSSENVSQDKPGLTHALYHEIDTGDKPPIVSHPYRYDRVKQVILNYHVEKMLIKGTIIPIQIPYASSVVLCRKNNGLPLDNPEAYRFAVDYRKHNAITKYPRYPLPLIDDLLMNIPHTTIMSALDLR
ncbi:uncharacterized protein TNCV_3268621 [Trichonephila clavipes]|nr:uncharacterized protein TNCV_3268621 [Trichonephila clavipes]